MSNYHVNPYMLKALECLSPPLKAAIVADRQYIDAAQSRIHYLEKREDELQTQVAHLSRQVELLKSERNRLSAFCDSFCDWEQVMTGDTEPVPIDKDVVVEALKILRDRHLPELEEIIEPLHRKWLVQFYSDGE